MQFNWFFELLIIKELEISNCRLGANGIESLAMGLQKNFSIKRFGLFIIQVNIKLYGIIRLRTSYFEQNVRSQSNYLIIASR